MVGPLLAHTPPQFGDVPVDSAEIRLGAEIRELAERLAIPGMAYGVVRDGELLFDGAAGFSGTPEHPFSIHTPLDIASISKSIAAVAIMQAIERGELALSDPVVRYLPDFGGPAEITVRHLLSHTSEGIPVRSSPFAMAFFRNFVASSPRGALDSPDWTMPRIAELEAELDAREALGSYRFGHELVGNGLLELEGDAIRAGD
ncbi:MAG: serine hydrolase, partial [Acidobacteria bacterium]|nr:serine hydrolase [Acidobacteriota bacterium]